MEIWSGKGVSTLLGHSFRIGGTTHLLLLGIDPFIIMAQGQEVFTFRIIGECVRRLSLLLLTYTFLSTHQDVVELNLHSGGVMALAIAGTPDDHIQV